MKYLALTPARRRVPPFFCLAGNIWQHDLELCGGAGASNQIWLLRIFFYRSPVMLLRVCCSPRSSKSMLALKNDVIILSTGEKIGEITVITSQRVIRV